MVPAASAVGAACSAVVEEECVAVAVVPLATLVVVVWPATLVGEGVKLGVLEMTLEPEGEDETGRDCEADIDWEKDYRYKDRFSDCHGDHRIWW